MPENLQERQELIPANDLSVELKPAEIRFKNQDALEKLVPELARRYKGLVVTNDNYYESKHVMQDINKTIQIINRHRIDKTNEAKIPIKQFKKTIDGLLNQLQQVSVEIKSQLDVYDQTYKKNKREANIKRMEKLLEPYGLKPEEIEYNESWSTKSYPYSKFEREVVEKAKSIIQLRKQQQEMRQAIIDRADQLAIGSSPFLDQLKNKSLTEVLKNMDNYKNELINIEKEKEERKKEYEQANHKVIGNKVIDTSTSEIVDEIHTFLLKVSLSKFQYENLMRYLKDNGIKGKITKIKGDSNVQ